MTPAERARQIDKEEFAAECAAVRKRAQAYAKDCRKLEKQKFKAWLRDSPALSTGLAPLKIKRETSTYTIDGVSRTIQGWAEHIGITKHALIARRKKLGSMEAAVSAGICNMRGKRIVTITIDGEARTLQQWADHLGITYLALSQRIHRKGSLEAAISMGGPQRQSHTPGVVSDLPTSTGTGAGSTAQETPNLTFSGIEA